MDGKKLENKLIWVMVAMVAVAVAYTLCPLFQAVIDGMLRLINALP